MDAAVFEQVYGAFQDFHVTSLRCLAGGKRGTTAAIISRLSWYSLGSGATPRICRRRFTASARVMQRFLAESPWDDDTVIGRLQEYLGPRIGHPEAVWVLDGSDFPKQGRKSVGVARVLREAGQGGQLPGRNVPGLCQPAGPGLGGQAAVSAGELDLGQRPV